MSSDWCLARRVAAVHTTRPAAESEPAPALLAVVSVEPLTESLRDDVLFAAGQPNRSDLETVPQPPGDAMSDRDVVLQLSSKLACWLGISGWLVALGLGSNRMRLVDPAKATGLARSRSWHAQLSATARRRVARASYASTTSAAAAPKAWTGTLAPKARLTTSRSGTTGHHS